MAVVNVKKAQIILHRSILDEVLSALQKANCCQIYYQQEQDQNPDLTIQPTTKAQTANLLTQLNNNISEARYAIRFLTPYYTDPVGSMARAMGEKDQLSLSQLKKLAKGYQLDTLVASLRKHERELLEIRSNILQNRTLHGTISQIKNFPYDLSILTNGSSLVSGYIATGRRENLENWKKAIEENSNGQAEVILHIPTDKNAQPWVAAIYRNDLETAVLDASMANDVNKIDLPSSVKLGPDQELSKLDQAHKTLTDREQTLTEELRSIANQNMDNLQKLQDYWIILKDKHTVEDLAEQTDKVVLIKAWVPQGALNQFRDALLPWENLIDLSLQDPTPEDNPPILLKNRTWARPFEMITMLYGAPQYGTIDATSYLAPFFFIFFGMCLGDGGYGLMMIGLALFLMRKYKKMPGGIKNVMILLIACGVSTVLFGAITGSWFGDMIDAFGFLKWLQPVKNFFAKLDPMKNPIQLLMISLALGVIQILFGLCVAAWDNIRNKRYFEAFADQGGWMILLIGLIVFGLGSSDPKTAEIGKWTSIAGAAILILTQGRSKPSIIGKLISGILSLYNITGYLGDILSYSRLLALGLVSGAIGMIINLLAKQAAGGVPYIGWIFGLLIFVGGHIFNFLINILGAFVHDLRLQYVEFFGKFYNAGGEAFKPFGYKPDYVKIAPGDNAETAK